MCIHQHDSNRLEQISDFRYKEGSVVALCALRIYVRHTPTLTHSRFNYEEFIFEKRTTVLREIMKSKTTKADPRWIQRRMLTCPKGDLMCQICGFRNTGPVCVYRGDI